MALTVALIVGPTLALPAGVLAGETLLPLREVFPEPDGAALATVDRPLRALLEERSGPLAIVVHKSRRRLDLLAGGRLVKSYVVNLGLSPAGDKERRGDMRTPEGELFVCAKRRKSAFTRFLALAYPSPRHAARAVTAGRAGPALERAAAAAYRSRDRCPPQDGPLGGDVGIHGAGAWDRRGAAVALTDWTWGCVGLRDADVLELFERVPVGTPVTILPH